MSPLPTGRCSTRGAYSFLAAARRGRCRPSAGTSRFVAQQVRCVAAAAGGGSDAAGLQLQQQRYTTLSGVSMPSHASTVVIGGGVVGASIAYHLARAGMQDVVLLESHQIATLGSTSHGTGTVSAATPVHRVKPMLAYSVELYSRLEEETNEKLNYVPCGTLRLATSDTRVRDFKRYTSRDYYVQGDSCRTVLLDRDQVAQMCPLLKMDSVHGGLYTEGDGYVDPVGLTRALIHGATAFGAQVIETCEARKVDQTSTGTWTVDTDFGQIACKHVVNAAGVWMNDVARLSGITLPAVHVEHQFASIVKVAELQDTPIPCVIDHEAPFYIRQNGDGIAMAGGAGRFLADWIVGGEPPFESFDSDANRFRGWTDYNFTKQRASESYSYVYNWSLPPASRQGGRPTRRVGGAYPALKKNGARMTFRSGWETPAFFAVDDEPEASAIAREYVMVTNKCGLVDLSYKGKIELSGRDCKVFLDYVLASHPPEFSKVKPMLMLSERGRVMASLKVIHHDQFRSEYILLTDPEHELRDLWWLQQIINEHKFEVKISPVSEYLASFALIGPQSRAILSELGNYDMSDEAFPPNSTRLIRVSAVPCIAVRSSATGEMGWELFHNRADSLKLYESLHNEGRGHGLVDFGMVTLNTLRIEKGFKIWGREISLNTNPYELGQESMVDLTKDNFIGKAACVELSTKPVSRRLALLQVTDQVDPLTQPIPLGMEVVRVDGQEEMVGQTTSGCYSPKLSRPVSFAWLSRGVSDDATVSIDMTDYRLKATVLPRPPDIITDG